METGVMETFPRIGRGTQNDCDMVHWELSRVMGTSEILARINRAAAKLHIGNFSGNGIRMWETLVGNKGS